MSKNKKKAAIPNQNKTEVGNSFSAVVLLVVTVDLTAAEVVLRGFLAGEEVAFLAATVFTEDFLTIGAALLVAVFLVDAFTAEVFFISEF